MTLVNQQIGRRPMQAHGIAQRRVRLEMLREHRAGKPCQHIT